MLQWPATPGALLSGCMRLGCGCLMFVHPPSFTGLTPPPGCPPSRPGRFIWVLGGTGLYCFLTACTGLSSTAARDRRGQLGTYIALLALLVLAQAGVTLLLLTDNAWRGRIPGEAGR